MADCRMTSFFSVLRWGSTGVSHRSHKLWLYFIYFCNVWTIQTWQEPVKLFQLIEWSVPHRNQSQTATLKAPYLIFLCVSGMNVSLNCLYQQILQHSGSVFRVTVANKNLINLTIYKNALQLQEKPLWIQ